MRLAFILLLLTIIVNASLKIDRLQLDENEIAVFSREKEDQCQENEYYSTLYSKCEKCTICSVFSFERYSCSGKSNTVCEWCGSESAEPLSNAAVASFKNNCLKANLEFVDMKALEKKLEYLNENADLSASNEEYDAYDTYEQDYADYGRQDNSAEYNRMINEQVESHLKKVNEEVLLNDPIVEEQGEMLGGWKLDELRDIYNDKHISVVLDENDVMDSVVDLQEVPENIEIPPPLPPVLPMDYTEDDKENFENIEWDNWVDDRVKPIEINNDDIARDANGNDGEVVDVEINIDEDKETEEKNAQFTFYFYIFLSMFTTIFILRLLQNLCCRPASHKEVQLTPEQYQILVEGGAYAEEYNKTHGHENPLYLP